MLEKNSKASQRQLYRARRRARNFQARIELQKRKLEGAQIAKEEADALLAAARSKTIRSKSIVSGKTKRKTTIRKGFKKDLPYTLVADRTAYDAIPNPSKMTDRQLEDYGRKILFKREQQAVEASIEIGGSTLEEGEKYISAMDAYNEERKILRRRHGINYRPHLRSMAKDELESLRHAAMYSKGISIDTSRPVKPKLKPNMTAGEAADYISTRVSSLGRSLPGFGQAVKDISDAGILTEQQIANIIKDAPNSRNLTQLTNAMGFDDFGIPSYGDHLRMLSQRSGPSYSSQQLAQKQQWMIEHSQLLEEKKIADMKVAKAQAVLSTGFKDPTIETNYAKLSAPVADEIAQVTQKKAISTRTMERLMKSHTVAAGVAAGGLGLMYAFNRKRAEEQVGR